MAQSIVFVANGFTKENIRLQPWRYVYEIACSRASNNKVVVITEGDTEKVETQWQENLTVIETKYHSVKKQKMLKTLILALKPDELWWSTTPRTLAFYPLLSSINCRRGMASRGAEKSYHPPVFCVTIFCDSIV